MEEFLKKHNLSIKPTRIGRSYFLINHEISEIIKKIPARPEYAGLYLGMEKKSFHPSPALIDIAAKNSKNQAIINQKAEWMFLCGNDVFEENSKGKMQGEVFVMNEHKENLGLGIWTRKKGRKIIKNLQDKGLYLRK